jgi:hypothetical protein
MQAGNCYAWSPFRAIIRVVREWVMPSQTVKCEACQKRDRTASRLARGLTRPRRSFSPP